MNRNNCRKYFNGKKPTWSILLFVLGAVLILAGIPDGDMPILAIGILAVIGGVFLFYDFRANCSDKALDNFCNSQAADYFSRKKSLVETKGYTVNDEIYSHGYCFDNIFSARKMLRGKDGIYRSSILESSCLLFTNETGFYFNEKISLITDEVCENQKEFDLNYVLMVSIEEIDCCFIVIITLLGNDKIHVKHRNIEEAIELCDKIKNTCKIKHC